MKNDQFKYEEWWRQVLQNDMQALKRIYTHFHPNLYQYALKLTTDSSLAEDSIHDTFLYLWQHRQKIGTIQSLPFYLFRSVRNACIKLIQKKKRIKNWEEVETQIDLRIEPKELYLTDNQIHIKIKIKAELATLSPRQREIIYLKFYNNLDYEEIGEVLNINYQSVVNHVYRAIQKLRVSKTLQFLKNK